MVFDLDGTLVDSHAVYYASLAQVLKTYSSELTEDDKAEILRISVRERLNFMTKKLGSQYAREALTMLEIKLRDDHLRTQAFVGIENILRKLQAKKVKLAVWTARELASAKNVLLHTGLDSFFSVTKGGTCVSVCKPNPEGLSKIADELGSTPEETYMVGDHDNDMLAAKAFGAKAIRAYWHNPALPLTCNLADFKFNQVTEFDNWVTGYQRS